jgi:hypothetical protein
VKVAGLTPVGEPEGLFEPDAASTGVLAGHEGTDTMVEPAPGLTVEKVLDGAGHTLSVTGTTGMVMTGRLPEVVVYGTYDPGHSSHSWLAALVATTGAELVVDCQSPQYTLLEEVVAATTGLLELVDSQSPQYALVLIVVATTTGLLEVVADHSPQYAEVVVDEVTSTDLLVVVDVISQSPQ